MSHQRAGPALPLLFGLAPRGVYRAPDIAVGAVGSYPTVSPLPVPAMRDVLEVCLEPVTEPNTSAVYSLWHFPWPPHGSGTRSLSADPLVLPGALPSGVRTFLHSGNSARAPEQRSPGLPALKSLYGRIAQRSSAWNPLAALFASGCTIFQRPSSQKPLHPEWEHRAFSPCRIWIRGWHRRQRNRCFY